jgi:hypothetical protein
VEAFAGDHRIDRETTGKLVDAAQRGARNREEADDFMSSTAGSKLFLSLITSWEPPELSADFRARFGLT